MVSENRMDEIAQIVEANVSQFMDKHGRLSAAKLAGRFYLNANDSYAVKHGVEWSLDQMARDPDYGGSEDHPIPYADLSNHRNEVHEKAQKIFEARQKELAGKNGVGMKSES